MTKDMPKDGWYWLKIGASYQWVVAWIDEDLVHICGVRGTHQADSFPSMFPSAIWGEQLTPPPEDE